MESVVNIIIFMNNFFTPVALILMTIVFLVTPILLYKYEILVLNKYKYIDFFLVSLYFITRMGVS